MRTHRRSAGLFLVLAAAPLAAQQPAAPPDDSVTTRWLPDPFPDAPPLVRDVHAVVEADVASRTPCVLYAAYDVECDPLAVVDHGQPAHGRVEAEPDGTFRYTPRPGFVGDDAFAFTVGDGRGGKGTATLHLKVIRPTGRWSTTSFTDLRAVPVGERPMAFRTATCPRVVDWDGDGRLDLLVGADGGVTLFRNVGTATAPAFAAGAPVLAGAGPLVVGHGRVAIAWVDVDRDGHCDLVTVADDRVVRWARNTSTGKGAPALAAAVALPAATGGDCVAADVRAEVADWNGDGLPDLLTGTGSGAIQVAYGVATATGLAFAAPTKVLDADGRSVEGSYNLNVRLCDLDQDGVPDFVDSYNWGTIQFRINQGSAAAPRLPGQGTFRVTGAGRAELDLHQLTDGPIADFADLDGDGTLDLIAGGEIGGTVRVAHGESAAGYLQAIAALFAAHPQDLGTWLADPAHAGERRRMQDLHAALYDYVATLATPGQKQVLVDGLLALIRAHPHWLVHRTFDLQSEPGMAALAAQVWLTTLVADYDRPAARRALADAAQLPGGYRRLVEDCGLLYVDNARNPRGAEAIHQWLRTVPRALYPGNGITANDWLGGGGSFLVRGHLKNTFNGNPVDRGEYGFGDDARAVIGERGSENWFLTVVHHEACHDLDAYVRRSPRLLRRWGQMLCAAAGPDVRADPATGWWSRERTQAHFREAGLWDGAAATWEAAWKGYWAQGVGAEWNRHGFLRGNISWFLDAPQESLATQGNQYWNSGEGRFEVAIDRWRRGFRSNLGEALFFLEIWSQGLDKVQFCENDNACRQVIGFARLRRNAQGWIDRIDLGDRCYEFAVDAEGTATALLHVPEPRR